jgi:Cd(II)/Pb(II)-responsive transcriptional regulator
MKIGELATATDTAVETIRFYEREGLIAEPARTDSNYRQYGPAQVQRLAFIRRCRSLDMSLDEVRILLRFLDRPAADCGEVNSVLDEHIEHVARRVRELKLLEKQLRELRAHCNSERKGQPCGILEELSADRRADADARRPSSTGHAHVGAVHGRPGTAKRS